MSRHAAHHDPLPSYTAKRDFKVTPEPEGRRARASKALSFVIQKHWASSLHYDFRLEFDGVLWSWAVPKGPSFDPKAKRLAVHVEDHPVSYGGFEGTIPARQYGAGTVIVWDRGTWEPVGDAREGMEKGKIIFHLHGEKLAGLWELVRISKPGDKKDPWMLFKKHDAWARPLVDYDVIAALPDSVVAKPLGLIEEREPKAASTVAGPPSAAATPALHELSGAVKAALPGKLQPQLATLSKLMPPAREWIYEIKFDGYRLMARIERGKVRFFTRGGHDWTSKLESLAREVESLGVTSGWLDGEVVVLNDDGVPSFSALQNAFDAHGTGTISYFLFDAPFFEGYDLRNVPLAARRALLKQLLDAKGTQRVRFSEDFVADARSVLQTACSMKLEGIMAKRKDARYVSARTETWLKLKCLGRQEFVIVGFTDRSGAKGEVGGLLLGCHEGGKLVYAGKVGTGWNAKSGKELHKKLVKIEVDQPAMDTGTVKPGRWGRRSAGSERWVKPTLVAEVSFAEWTPEGHIRHGSFQGLRDDKPAKAITRERATVDADVAVQTSAANRVGSVKVSNPQRVIDPSTGLTKLDLVRYYESIAERMIPHLKDRPVTLVRAPSGITGEQFFQKHDDKLSIPGLRELDPALWEGHAALLEVPTREALVNAAQMNVVEFHTWNSKTRKIDKPDRVIFDLDPGEGVGWEEVQEAALLTRTLLTELELDAWLKTSGGKGLHVVVPLAPRLDYAAVKDFSQAAVQHLARTIPSRFVAKSGGGNREGRIFVDYLRNGHGQTTAAAFSARARPGMGVSMPVSWDDLASLKSGAQWTIATAREYLSFQKTDPWEDYWKSRQTLSAALKRLKG
jgi:bifunctional non-homologous end joining protein LigD